jgi:hypothetical protein
VLLRPKLGRQDFLHSGDRVSQEAANSLELPQTPISFGTAGAYKSLANYVTDTVAGRKSAEALYTASKNQHTLAPSRRLLRMNEARHLFVSSHSEFNSVVQTHLSGFLPI